MSVFIILFRYFRSASDYFAQRQDAVASSSSKCFPPSPGSKCKLRTHLVGVTKTAKTASLRAINPKLIDDCDLVNDKLLLSFPKMTTKPHCISQITMRFMNMDPPFEVTVPVNGSLEYLNPFRGHSDSTGRKMLDKFYDLYNFYTRHQKTVDLAQVIPEKSVGNLSVLGVI